MSTYTHPVASLLTLGEPEHRRELEQSTSYGFSREHIPELIRLLQDNELARSQDPEWFAQIHAWRALAQLRAEEAIDPLLDLLSQQEDGDDYSDWAVDEVPTVLGMMGPAMLAPTVARLEQRGSQVWAPVYYAEALGKLATHSPETRDEVIRQLCRVLETANENGPGLNGFLMWQFLDLKATEAWPLIKTAFETGNVDKSIAGDAHSVEYELGLRSDPPPRPNRDYLLHPPTPAPGSTNFGTNAKQRFKERQRKKKQQKKLKKLRRKAT